MRFWLISAQNSGEKGLIVEKRSVRPKAFRRKARFESICCSGFSPLREKMKNLETTAIGTTVRSRSVHTKCLCLSYSKMKLKLFHFKVIVCLWNLY